MASEFPSRAAEEFHGKDMRERLDWACGVVLVGIGAGNFRGAVQQVIEAAMGAAHVNSIRVERQRNAAS